MLTMQEQTLELERIRRIEQALEQGEITIGTALFALGLLAAARADRSDRLDNKLCLEL